MRYLTFLLAVAAALLLSASAASGSAWLPEADLAARSYWTARGLDTSVCPTVTYKIEKPEGFDAWGWQEGCAIYLAPVTQKWSYVYICEIVAHEWGHILGLGHSTKLLDIMYPRLPVLWILPECKEPK